MRKLLVLLVLLGGLGGYLYFARGPVGRAVGFARTWARPEDTGILAFLPVKSPGALVTQLPLVQLPEHQKLQAELARIRQEILAKSGVDLVMDVDTVAWSPTVQVARGRFRWSELVEKLTLEGYSLDENGPTPLLKKGSSALAAVRPYLVFGETADVQAALADQRAGTGLSSDARILALLKEAGWRSAVLTAVRVEDDKGRPLPGSDLFKNAQGSVLALLGNYRVKASATAVSAGQGRRAEAMFKDTRANLVQELRRSNTKQAQELANALEASEISFDESTNALTAFLKVPIEVFNDGVEQAAQDVGLAALGSRLNLTPRVATPPTPPPPALPADATDAELLELNGLVREVCETQWHGCTLQKRADLLNVAARLKGEGKATAAIRVALVELGTPAPVIPAAGNGIGVEAATYGANCGAKDGNASQAVMMACNGKKLCSYVVDPAVLGLPASACRRSFDVSWRCGAAPDAYRATVTPPADGKQPITLLCD